MSGDKNRTCIERFVVKFESYSKAAKALSDESGRPCTKQRMYEWLEKGYIPWSFALPVDEITKSDKDHITVREILVEATNALKG